MSEDSSETSEATADIPRPATKKPKRTSMPTIQPKKFGETIEGKALAGVGKVAWEATKLGGSGAVFVGKEGILKGYGFAKDSADVVFKTAKLGWKYRRDLMVGAVGSALTVIAQSPRESINVSREAYEQVVKQVGHVRDFGGEQPSKTAFDALGGAEKSNPLLDSVVDTHYQGMVGEEREQLKHQVELMGIYMADIMTAEGFANVAANEGIFEAECAKVGVNPGIIEGISFAETGGGVLGKLEHKTDAGALGPLGITDAFAVEHGMVITNDANDPRLNWYDSIQVACGAIGEYTKTLGDVSLATAAWHRGPVAVGDDIRFWANANGLVIGGTIAEFSKLHGLNDWKLRQNKELRESWETDKADMTNIYPTRVAGSSFLKLNVEAMALKQLEESNALVGD